MIFTEINGVDEGSILICGLCFVTAYLGNTFWKQDVSYPGLPYGILDEPRPLHHILLAFVISTIYPYALSPFWSIWKGRHSEHFKKTWSLYYFMIQIFFYFFSLYTFTMVQVYSIDEIYKTH
jgi:hypothetical protein